MMTTNAIMMFVIECNDDACDNSIADLMQPMGRGGRARRWCGGGWGWGWGWGAMGLCRVRRRGERGECLCR